MRLQSSNLIMFQIKGIYTVSYPKILIRRGYMLFSIMHKSTGVGRPKKKIYYRVQDLDRVMDLQKKTISNSPAQIDHSDPKKSVSSSKGS